MARTRLKHPYKAGVRDGKIGYARWAVGTKADQRAYDRGYALELSERVIAERNRVGVS